MGPRPHALRVWREAAAAHHGGENKPAKPEAAEAKIPSADERSGAWPWYSNGGGSALSDDGRAVVERPAPSLREIQAVEDPVPRYLRSPTDKARQPLRGDSSAPGRRLSRFIARRAADGATIA